MEESIEFYKFVLDFDLVKRVEMEEHERIKELVYLRLGDTLLELISVENPAESSGEDWQVGYRAIAIEVGDMEAALKEIPGDVDVVWGPRDMGDFKRTEIEDPNGLPIELREWRN